MIEPITPALGGTGYPAVVGPGAPSEPGTSGPTYLLGRRGWRVNPTAVTGSRVARATSRAFTIRNGLTMLGFSVIWLVFCFAFLKPLTWDDAQVGDGEASSTGVVVDQHSQVDTDGHRMCTPEASFTVGGQEYVAALTGSSSDCPARGSEVEVIYRVADPTDSRVAPGHTMQLLLLIFLIAGFAMLVVALSLLFGGFGGTALVARLRARRLPEEPGISPPASPPVAWSP